MSLLKLTNLSKLITLFSPKDRRFSDDFREKQKMLINSLGM